MYHRGPDFRTPYLTLSKLTGPLTQVAQELGVCLSTLTRWRAESRDSGEDVFPGKGQQTPEQAEITRLRRELARVTQQREILKKAITFFHDCLLYTSDAADE